MRGQSPEYLAGLRVLIPEEERAAGYGAGATGSLAEDQNVGTK